MSRNYDINPDLVGELAKTKAEIEETLARENGEDVSNRISPKSIGEMARIDADSQAFLEQLRQETQKVYDELGIKTNVEDKKTNDEIDEMLNKITEKSVGTVEIKKLKRSLSILIAIVTAASISFAVLVEYLKTHNKVAELRAGYANYEELKEFDVSSEEFVFSYREVGSTIANSIIEKATNSYNLDVNRELIFALGTINLPAYGYSKAEAFADNGDNPYYMPQGWAERIYAEARKTLMEAGIIELPETLKEYMTANGFAKGHFRFNDITKEINFEPLKDGEELTVDEIYKNLKEFAQAYAVDRVLLDDVQGIGGR